MNAPRTSDCFTLAAKSVCTVLLAKERVEQSVPLAPSEVERPRVVAGTEVALEAGVDTVVRLTRPKRDQGRIRPRGWGKAEERWRCPLGHRWDAGF